MPNPLQRTLAALAASLVISSAAQAKPRLILLVEEGLGHEMINAARLYSEAADLWDWRLDTNWTYASVSTLPLTTRTAPDGSDPEALPAYDSLKAWDGTEISLTPESLTQTTFVGYKWLIENATDRQQVATALGSGTPSFNTSINWLSYPQKSGTPLPPTQQLLEWANYNGLKTGIISDMPFSHGTNTILGGARFASDETAIARFNYIVKSSPLDLYVATGHPKYNELGQALSDPRYVFCTQNDWQDLRAKTRASGWNLIFGDENLMGVNAQSGAKNERRMVILQYGDTTSTDAVSADASGLSASLATSLRFQIKMALDNMNQSENGFVLVIHMGRLPYFLKSELQKESVEEVVNTFRTIVMCEQWVENNSGWDDTSLILVSAYEYGLIWGSESSSFPYAQVTNRGKKRVPGFRINHKGPTAALAPLLIRGDMAKSVSELYQAEDPIYGEYLPISKLGTLLKRFVTKPESKVEQP